MIAILLSGHLRKFNEIIQNFKENLIDKLSERFVYHIYIHTWETNISGDNILNNDKYFTDDIITEDYIYDLFNKYNLTVYKIKIENQNNIMNLEEYLVDNCKNRSIHNKKQEEYVYGITRKLYWQYYGHSKCLELIDQEYDYIIKTRPDLLYKPFNLKILKKELFFPNSHQKDGTNINQLFFGGKSEYIIQILNYFNEIIYNDNKINFNLIQNYHKSDINFNQIFRFYILNILELTPEFIEYNPRIYRNKNNIILIK